MGSSAMLPPSFLESVQVSQGVWARCEPLFVLCPNWSRPRSRYQRAIMGTMCVSPSFEGVLVPLQQGMTNGG